MVQKIIAFNVALKSTEKQWVQKIPEVYTNDLGSVSIKFNITDCTDTELTGSSAIVLLKMRDGSFFQGPSVDVERTLNVFSYTLKENEGNHDGLAEIQLIVTISGKEFATQKYQFKVNSGLDSEVAREIMIYDWTTLTAEARAYIDQFTADEMVRDAEFDNNEFDRNTAFVASQDARTLAFGTEQTNRGTAFTAEQTNRGTAFTAEQNDRTTEFNESESGRTVAESGRVTAESNRVTAESGRVTAESGRVTAETNRTTAESSRVTAESGRVTAESGRVTAESGRVTAETNRAAAFTAFDTRLTAEETATAANKISTVKGKTFTDVDARFEDVETDTTVMATNLVTNGDFSNGTTGWSSLWGNNTVVDGKLISTGDGGNSSVQLLQNTGVTAVPNNMYYFKAKAKVTTSGCNALNYSIYSTGGLSGSQIVATNPTANTDYEVSRTIKIGNGTYGSLYIYLMHQYADSASANGKVMQVDNFICLNLTATFGKGNEPTVEQMDEIMSKFPNSWFDGTKNLFRASETLKKQIAMDARTEFDAKNLVVNGDFSNGITGWNTTTLASHTVSSGVSSFVANAKGGGIYQIVGGIGNKFYLAAEIKADSTSVTLRNNTSSIPISQLNVFQKLSMAYTATNSNVPGILDQRDSAWTEVQVKNVININLTATFGAGKEPTLAEMDRLMARFPNSWFDGVKPIQTIETLYQEKANKTQEAWITPTLTSGISASGYPISYRKNTIGQLEIKGRVDTTNLNNGSALFTLAIGYRPFESKSVPASNVTTNGVARMVVQSGGSVTFVGYAKGEILDIGITLPLD